MNRRSFVTLLSSGLAALCLPQIEWVPSGPTSELVVPSADAVLTDIDQITAEMLRQMTQRLPDLRGTFVPGAYRLGEHGLTDHWNVQLQPSVMRSNDLQGLTVRESIAPAAAVMVEKVRGAGLRRFGAFPCAMRDIQAAVATDERSGLSVRGLRQYFLGDELQPEGWMYRFDVVGGRAAA